MDINDKFVKACREGDLPAAKKYIGQKLRADTINYALQQAAQDGRLEVIKCLGNRADIHTQGDYALRYASHFGHLEVVKYLIEHGANIHMFSDEALRWATGNGHLQVANVLRKAAGDKYKCHKCIIRSTCLELCDDFRQH
jgi:hypothetical protein